MHEQVRVWIADLLVRRAPLLAIAFRQRAKFEGWLKFELAAAAEQNGATDVCVEAPPDDPVLGTDVRSDVTFRIDGVRYDVELKTPNSNWRLPGVESRTRPITKNIAEIVADARKLASSSIHGIVAFVLFPIPPGSVLWQAYLRRIAENLDTPLSVAEHTTLLTVPVSSVANADAVVCCFEVRATTGSPPPKNEMHLTRSGTAGRRSPRK